MRFFFIAGCLLFHLNSLGQEISFRNVTQTHLPEISKTPVNSMDSKAGDIDKDGDMDIIVAVEFQKNIILINDGKGYFSDGSHLLPDLKNEVTPKPYPYYPYHDTEDIALEDFDNDGDLDIIFVSEDDKFNEFYLKTKNSQYTDVSHTFPAKGISNGVLAKDFDHDGWIDVIIGNNGQNTYLRNNHGSFVDETSKRLPEAEDITQDLQAMDFDDDGDLDIIVANEKSNTLLINDGSGIFKDLTHKYLKSEFLQEETREATFADIDSDGDKDLFFANVFMFQKVTPRQRLLVNQNNTTFLDETEKRLGFTSELSIIDAVFYDLDQDLDQDLLIVTYQGPKILLNDGAGFFKDITETALGNIKTSGIDIEIADYNGDRLPDIFISSFRGSDILLFQNNN